MKNLEELIREKVSQWNEYSCCHRKDIELIMRETAEATIEAIAVSKFSDKLTGKWYSGRTAALAEIDRKTKEWIGEEVK